MFTKKNLSRAMSMANGARPERFALPTFGFEPVVKGSNRIEAIDYVGGHIKGGWRSCNGYAGHP